jgi:hypothetical protein
MHRGDGAEDRGCEWRGEWERRDNELFTLKK